MGCVARKITAYMCRRFLENQGFWLVHWKCLRVAYTSKNTTKTPSRGSTRPSSTLLHSLKLKAACQSMGCVSKYGFIRLEDHSVYVHGFSKFRGSGWCTENAFAWLIHQRTQPRHLLEAQHDHYQHFCTTQNWRRRVKVCVVSLERSQRICVHGFSKIRVLGGALNVPSRDLCIKEHNRDIF